jgi:hypothetical protein
LSGMVWESGSMHIMQVVGGEGAGRVSFKPRPPVVLPPRACLVVALLALAGVLHSAGDDSDEGHKGGRARLLGAGGRWWRWRWSGAVFVLVAVGPLALPIFKSCDMHGMIKHEAARRGCALFKLSVIQRRKRKAQLPSHGTPPADSLTFVVVTGVAHPVIILLLGRSAGADASGGRFTPPEGATSMFRKLTSLTARARLPPSPASWVVS